MVPTRDKNWFCPNTLTGENNTTVLRKYVEMETNQADKILKFYALASTWPSRRSMLRLGKPVNNTAVNFNLLTTGKCQIIWKISIKAIERK